MPPAISIVTPSYNQGRFLEETLASVAASPGVNVEHIVIDGGSKDDSPAILKRLSSKLAYWCSESDAGQYDALNKGFALSGGEVMGWLNADDKYLPGALSVVTELFAQFPEIEWLTTQYPLRFDAVGRVVRCSARSGFSRAGFFAGENLPTGKWYAPGWLQQESTFWRRSLWERAGSKLETRWNVAADFELWLRFHRHAELYAVDTPLGGFRQHGNQRTTHQRQEYQREAWQIFADGGGRVPGYWRSSARSAAARFCPDFARPLAAATGLLRGCKLCLRKRDETGWRIVPAWH